MNLARVLHWRILWALLALAGSGIAAPARGTPQLCIDHDVISFGNHLLGTTTSATIVVSNCGDQSWSFTDVSVDPATGPAFQVPTTCTTGLTLTPGGACTASVLFAPVINGQTSGGLWLRNSTANAPQELLTFYGRGIDAQAGTASLAFVPANAAFGAQILNFQSAPLMVELHNDGPAALTPTKFVLNGPAAYDYSAVFDTCQVDVPIPAGMGCTLALYFQPEATGARLANLVIDSPQLEALAILEISGTGATTASAKVDVVEFYNQSLDHYFMSARASDITALDSGRFPGWARTGQSFKAYATQVPGSTSPVCRFYIPPQHGDSHFFSAQPADCAFLVVAAADPVNFPSFSGYVEEDAAAFAVTLPDATGACPGSTVPVFRMWNQRFDSDHRYTTSQEIVAEMLARNYVIEGAPPNHASMCAAIPDAVVSTP
jgi:Abnormal spindle-like microcephaly-assoc'd, ASPM-SPD-2-Hydin